VRAALELLGIPYRSETPDSAVAALAEERELCRTNKQFAQADDLRKKIGALGYSVDDTPIGPFVRKIPIL
jgi:cysteinyl-tRNA synthetase